MAELSTTKAAAAAKLLELIVIPRITESIRVAAELGVADLLADGPKSAEQLADATRVNAPSLQRVLRALASFGVFSQDDLGRFALSPMGEFLKSGVEGSLRPAALFYSTERWAPIIGQLLHCVKTGETAVQKLASSGWDLLQGDPATAELFNASMTAYSTLHLTGVLEAYDFSPIGKIVDVGGGHGKIISEILTKHPHMRGVLYDMPHAFEGGKKTITQAGLADRCDVVSGDFFQSIPAGADAYLLSRVIHDWDDQKAIAILKMVRGGIVPDGRLILLETMLRPAPRSLYPELSDLNMMIGTGGCERTEQEYRALFKAAEFELSKTVETTSPTGTAVIEGKPVLSGQV
jgi:hypothetical protein